MQKVYSLIKQTIFFICLAGLPFSCSNKIEEIEEGDVALPYLEKMSFLSSDNYLNLIEDVKCEIVGDSIVNCWINYLLPNKKLVAQIFSTGDVLCNGMRVVSGKTIIDYSKPQVFEIQKGAITKRYTVYVYSFTGLPVLWVETEGRKEIVSKEEYIKAHLKLVENVVTRSAGDIIEEDVFIKGRGNSSWEMPKKGYRLKFEKKVSLIDEPADKSWVLIPNYSDKTSLRNALAFYMGAHSNLEYTPKSHFVELMLNGNYNGLYLLCEKIKVSQDRVNIGDDGYLLEIDARAEQDADARVFRAPHILHTINIKEPYCKYGDENYNFIESYINEVDSVLFSNSFRDPLNGWQKYLDINSFVDWYLINEISNNQDAKEYSSIFLNLTPGGKLKMGPIWDFDIAFGNCNYQYSYEKLRIKTGQWYRRLFEDELFVSKVKERYAYFYNQKEDYLVFINSMANYLKYSIQENDKRWGTLYEYTWANYDIWGNYKNEIQNLKQWINNRFEWMKSAFDAM